MDAVAYLHPVLLERSAVKRDKLRSEFSACHSKHSTWQDLGNIALVSYTRETEPSCRELLVPLAEKCDFAHQVHLSAYRIDDRSNGGYTMWE